MSRVSLLLVLTLILLISGLYVTIPFYQILISHFYFLYDVPLMWLAKIRGFMSLMNLIFAYVTTIFMSIANCYLGFALFLYLLSFTSLTVIGVFGNLIPETLFLRSCSEFIRTYFRFIQILQYGEVLVPLIIILYYTITRPTSRTHSKQNKSSSSSSSSFSFHPDTSTYSVNNEVFSSTNNAPKESPTSMDPLLSRSSNSLFASHDLSDVQPLPSQLSCTQQQLNMSQLLPPSKSSILKSSQDSSFFFESPKNESDSTEILSNKDNPNRNTDIQDFGPIPSIYKNSNNLSESNTRTDNLDLGVVPKTNGQSNGIDKKSYSILSEGSKHPSAVCCFCKKAFAKVRLQPCEHEFCSKCVCGSGRCIECGAIIMNHESLS